MEQQCRKVYVEVQVRVSPEGDVRPLSIKFEDGKLYEIDRLLHRCRAHATKVGGTGIRYTVRIRNQETYLFEDEGRWFVEAKTILHRCEVDMEQQFLKSQVLFLHFFHAIIPHSACRKRRENMNTSTSTAPILHSREFFQQKETAVLQQIPGVYELLSAYDDQRPALEKKYPDAAFALNISSNLFFHDGELTNIHMKAYSSILKGDPIADVHFRYDKEMDAYHARHNWD